MSVTAMGVKMQGVQSLLGTLGNFNLVRLQELLAAVSALQSAETLQTQVSAALRVLRVGATLTPTDADDDVIAFIDKLLTDELLDDVARVIAAFRSDAAGEKRSIGSQMRMADVTAKGIPWSMLVQLVPVLLQVIETFRKK